MSEKNPKLKNARQIALTVLDKFDKTDSNIKDLLNSNLHQTDQKAQATDIAFGVIRNRFAIDMVIEIIAVPLERIPRKFINIMRIGAYELIYSPKTADYAIINEAVNLTHNIAGKKQAGFINACLRNISRAIADRSAPLENADQTRILPQSKDTGCLFKQTILPDPDHDYPKYLSAAFSIPLWLIKDWTSTFGKQETLQICLATNRKPATFVFPNTLKTNLPELEKLFSAENIEFHSHQNQFIELITNHAIPSLPGFNEGMFIVQDPTAAKVAQYLDPKPGQTILDLCAAPGGKTVRLAQLMQNTGTIIASDIDTQRLEMVNDNCKRLGITNVNIVPHNELESAIAKVKRFDSILMDVPCSNTGVIARRCEVKLKITEASIKKLAEKQLEILQNTANLNKTDKILYSTCSIHPTENSDLIDQFLKQNPAFRLNSRQITLPSISYPTSPEHDGGYMVILTKTPA